MGANYFTEEQLKGLRGNSYVKQASEKAIIHSDQDCYYTTILFRELLKKLEAIIVMQWKPLGQYTSRIIFFDR